MTPLSPRWPTAAMLIVATLLSLCTTVLTQQPTKVTLCSGPTGACTARNGSLPDYPWATECSCLTRVVNLTLVDWAIQRLPETWASPGAFPELKLLNLSYNSITELPPGWGARGAFPKLTQAWFSFNRLQSLPQEWGTNGSFPALAELRLGTNKIRFLPDAPASGPFFPVLRNLTFPANQITGGLPASWGRRGAFPKLQVLIFDHNNVTEVPAAWGETGAFPELVALYLGDNKIAIIPETWGTAGGFPQLEELNLDQNRIAACPASWQTNTTFLLLSILGLADNQLTSLPENWGTPSAFFFLERLYLQGNRIATLPAAWGRAFRFLALTRLFLSNNQIEAVPATWTARGAFPQLLNLQLANNQLTSAPVVSSNASWPDMVFLNLTGNRINTLPSDWGALGGFEKLVSLALANNSFARLPEAWSDPDRFNILINLDVSGGQLEELPWGWFANSSFPNLFIIDASGNRLTGLPSGWGEPGRVCSVVKLDVSNNRISDLPESWVSLRALAIFNLSNNLIEELPAGWTNETASLGLLYNLDLADNRLRALPSEWGFSNGFPALTTLNISRNNVIKIPDSWAFRKTGNDSFQLMDELKITDTPSLANRRLESIFPGFWTKCINSNKYGCAANFLGSNVSTRVSASFKRSVCFSNITVLFRGPPGYELPRRINPAVSSAFPIVQFDEIDLGPGGVHLTGVRFAPRPGNLCRNDRAVLVVSLMWGATAGALLLGMVALRVCHVFRPFEPPALARARRRAPAGSREYFQGIAGAGWHIVSLALDLRVLHDVWIQELDTWVKWVLLTSLVVQFLASGLFLAAAWWAGAWGAPPPGAGKPANRAVTTGFHWWVVADAPYTHPDSPAPVSFKHFCLAVATAPLGAAATVVLDAVAVGLRLGFHPVVHGRAISLDPYVAARGLAALLFEGIPQSLLQSALYVKGNSAATNFYIDDAIFVPPLVFSLASLLKYLLMKYKDALSQGRFGLKELWYELRNMCPISIDLDDAAAIEEAAGGSFKEESAL